MTALVEIPRAPASPSARESAQPAGVPIAPPTALRVIVADDHPMYRRGIVRALEAAGVTVVAEAGDGEIALALIRHHEPDVALLDVSMPGLDGIDVVAALARQGPQVPVVLLSAFSDEPLVRAGLQAGAATYVTKTADRDEILRAVTAAATPTLGPRALAGSGDLQPGNRRTWIPRLTRLEYDALRLARSGADKPEMALRLGIDEPAVRRALSSAISKIGADTLPEAVRLAAKVGVLD